MTGGGSAIITGGTLVFDAQSNVNVAFDNGPGTPVYGELALGDASGFSGQISGFTGTAPDTAHSDAIDLKDIPFGSNITFVYDANAGTDTGGTLTIFESGDTVDSITFANGEYTTASFKLSSDGLGGTLITDPPTSTNVAATSPSNSADTFTAGSNDNNTGGSHTLMGGDDHDTFVFKAITDSQPGAGNFDTITNFTHNSDHFDFTAISGLNSAVQPVTIQLAYGGPRLPRRTYHRYRDEWGQYGHLRQCKRGARNGGPCRHGDPSEQRDQCALDRFHPPRLSETGAVQNICRIHWKDETRRV